MKRGMTKRDMTSEKSEKSEKKLFSSKLGASKKLVQLDDAALQQVTAGYGCGGGPDWW